MFSIKKLHQLHTQHDLKNITLHAAVYKKTKNELIKF